MNGFRNTAFVFVFILGYLSSSADELRYTYYFTNPVVIDKGEDYQSVSFDQTIPLGRAGEPELPYFAIKILLPPGHIATDIRFEVSGLTTMEGSFELFPRQNSRPLSMGASGEFEKNKKLYRQKEGFPLKPGGGLKTSFLHGHAIATAVLTPMLYFPAAKMAAYYSEIVVIITTVPDEKASEALSNIKSGKESLNLISDYVQNPEMAIKYPRKGNRSTNYDYLIITKEQFEDDFDTLATFYQHKGYVSKIVSSEHIDSTETGVDLQEKMRNFIIGEYQDKNISYVLIGGDHDLLPCRYFYCRVQSSSVYTGQLPADLYFAALDGSWNDDGDGNWGEVGEEDLYPELSVGRFSFSTAAELENMLHKTMSYQNFPVEGDLEDPLMLGEHLWSNPETWGAQYMNLLIGSKTENGYSTTGINPVHEIDSLYERELSWSGSRLIDSVNAGISAIHHCGHSNYTAVMKLSTSSITNANFYAANGTDHQYPVVYTHGCNCGGFDYGSGDCVAEYMVKIDNFASAFIGNSRYGWFVEGTTDGPAEHLHREWVDAVYNDSLYWIGRALMESKIMTAPYVGLPEEYEPGAMRWNFYDINVLGDPLMAMWTYEPMSPSIDYPHFIVANATTMEVNISDASNPLKNMQCALMMNDTLCGGALSNDAGTASITILPGLQEGMAQLLVSGYNSLPDTMNVFVSDLWLGNNADWNDPLNWASGNIPVASSNVIVPASPSGGYYPSLSSSGGRQCNALYIEPGASVHIEANETITIYGN